MAQGYPPGLAVGNSTGLSLAKRRVARAWVRVLWRAWTDRKPYDVANHRAAKQFIQTVEG
jgi:hypothetical protein